MHIVINKQYINVTSEQNKAAVGYISEFTASYLRLTTDRSGHIRTSFWRLLPPAAVSEACWFVHHHGIGSGAFLAYGFNMGGPRMY